MIMTSLSFRIEQLNALKNLPQGAKFSHNAEILIASILNTDNANIAIEQLRT
jgi:hypothetical protein